MQKIGLETIVLFLASVACFLFGAYAPAWANVAMISCGLFFVAACVILAVSIKTRRKTIVG
jgi:hypothetical protein